MLRKKPNDKMLSVKGVYDGKNLKLLDKVDVNEPKDVIVTFLESIDSISSDEILQAADHGGSFDFLDSEDEDIYSDKDLKVRYK